MSFSLVLHCFFIVFVLFLCCYYVVISLLLGWSVEIKKAWNYPCSYLLRDWHIVNRTAFALSVNDVSFCQYFQDNDFFLFGSLRASSLRINSENAICSLMLSCSYATKTSSGIRIVTDRFSGRLTDFFFMVIYFYVFLCSTQKNVRQ